MTNNAQAEMVVAQAAKELASLILDQDQWECGCEKCHARLTELIARHRAAEIERMAGEIAALRAALAPFAKAGGVFVNPNAGEDYKLGARHLRIARQALGESQ